MQERMHCKMRRRRVTGWAGRYLQQGCVCCCDFGNVNVVRGQGRGASGGGLFSKACPAARLRCEGVQHKAWAGEQVLCTTPQQADLHKPPTSPKLCKTCTALVRAWIQWMHTVDNSWVLQLLTHLQCEFIDKGILRMQLLCMKPHWQMLHTLKRNSSTQQQPQKGTLLLVLFKVSKNSALCNQTVQWLVKADSAVCHVAPCLLVWVLFLKACCQRWPWQSSHALPSALRPHVLCLTPASSIAQVLHSCQAVVPPCYHIHDCGLCGEGMHGCGDHAGGRYCCTQLPLAVVTPAPQMMLVCQCHAVPQPSCDLQRGTDWKALPLPRATSKHVEYGYHDWVGRTVCLISLSVVSRLQANFAFRCALEGRMDGRDDHHSMAANLGLTIVCLANMLNNDSFPHWNRVPRHACDMQQMPQPRLSSTQCARPRSVAGSHTQV